MLFDKPLYEMLRPLREEEFVGHKGIVNTLKPQNLILWGPPGIGKTTIANLLSKKWQKPFYQLSAVLSGKKEVKETIDIIEKKGIQSIIFIDEIHAFNKTQQNVFLQHIEKGLVIFIGATTENPSFEIISPLISRALLIKMEKLKSDELKAILKRAVEFLRANDFNFTFYGDFLNDIVIFSDGDARIALNTFENIVDYVFTKGGTCIEKDDVIKNLGAKVLLYDKKYEEHYNLLSAFHKSLRGSDPDAALYWGFRMLESGEEPRNIFRRLIACASEDIGNADPIALTVAVNAWKSFEFLGRPEGDLPLGQAILYIATAPKSNSVYKAIKQVKASIKSQGYLPVPIHLRNAVNNVMKKLGYGKQYKYPHDYPYAFVKQNYLPDELKNKRFYEPNDVGFEREIKKRLFWWKKLCDKESSMQVDTNEGEN